MQFYIVTAPVRLVEEDRGRMRSWCPDFFEYLYTLDQAYADIEPLMRRREITPELLKDHLRSMDCWSRQQFDSLAAAQAFAKEAACTHEEAVPVYSCSIPDNPCVLILGKPDSLPSNAVFLDPNEFSIDSVSLHNKSTIVLEIDCSETTYRHHI